MVLTAQMGQEGRVADRRKADRRKGVALCSQTALLEEYGTAFTDLAPQIDLRAPQDIADPAQVEFALAWKPAPDAFAPFPNLRAVFSIGAGMDPILACPSLPRDVLLRRVEDPDQADQMAGFAVFQTLWHHRDLFETLRAQAEGRWSRVSGGRSPAAVPVGILGFGHMGRSIARALVGLGYPVLSLTRSAPDPEPGVTHHRQDTRAAFLSRCRILINVLPMTDATRGMLNAALFDELPQGAALIHLGRGAQLNEADLLGALASGRLSGASLDVFAQEPLPADHAFWRHPRILVTPHTASEAEPPAIVASVLSGLAALDRERAGAGGSRGQE